MNSKIKIARGLEATTPTTVNDGELRYAKDTGRLFVSSNNKSFSGGAGNELIASAPVQSYTKTVNSTSLLVELSNLKNRSVVGDVRLVLEESVLGEWELTGVSGSGKVSIDAAGFSAGTINVLDCTNVHLYDSVGGGDFKLSKIEDSTLVIHCRVIPEGANHIRRSFVRLTGPTAAFVSNGVDRLSIFDNSTVLVSGDSDGAAFDAEVQLGVGSTFIISPGVVGFAAVVDGYGQILDYRTSTNIGSYDSKLYAQWNLASNGDRIKLTQWDSQAHYYFDSSLSAVILNKPPFVQEFYLDINGNKATAWGIYNAKLLVYQGAFSSDGLNVEWQLIDGPVPGYSKTLTAAAFLREIAFLNDHALDGDVDLTVSSTFPVGSEYEIKGISGPGILTVNYADNSGVITGIRNCSNVILAGDFTAEIPYIVDSYVTLIGATTDQYHTISLDANATLRVATGGGLFKGTISLENDATAIIEASTWNGSVNVNGGSRLFIGPDVEKAGVSNIYDNGGLIIDMRPDHTLDTYDRKDFTNWNFGTSIGEYLGALSTQTGTRTKQYRWYVSPAAASLITDKPLKIAGELWLECYGVRIFAWGRDYLGLPVSFTAQTPSATTAISEWQGLGVGNILQGGYSSTFTSVAMFKKEITNLTEKTVRSAVTLNAPNLSGESYNLVGVNGSLTLQNGTSLGTIDLVKDCPSLNISGATVQIGQVVNSNITVANAILDNAPLTIGPKGKLTLNAGTVANTSALVVDGGTLELRGGIEYDVFTTVINGGIVIIGSDVITNIFKDSTQYPEGIIIDTRALKDSDVFERSTFESWSIASHGTSITALLASLGGSANLKTYRWVITVPSILNQITDKPDNVVNKLWIEYGGPKVVAWGLSGTGALLVYEARVDATLIWRLNTAGDPWAPIAGYSKTFNNIADFIAEIGNLNNKRLLSPVSLTITSGTYAGSIAIEGITGQLNISSQITSLTFAISNCTDVNLRGTELQFNPPISNSNVTIDANITGSVLTVENDSKVAIGGTSTALNVPNINVDGYSTLYVNVAPVDFHSHVHSEFGSQIALGPLTNGLDPGTFSGLGIILDRTVLAYSNTYVRNIVEIWSQSVQGNSIAAYFAETGIVDNILRVYNGLATDVTDVPVELIDKWQLLRTSDQIILSGFDPSGTYRTWIGKFDSAVPSIDWKPLDTPRSYTWNAAVQGITIGGWFSAYPAQVSSYFVPASTASLLTDVPPGNGNNELWIWQVGNDVYCRGLRNIVWRCPKDIIDAANWLRVTNANTSSEQKVDETSDGNQLYHKTVNIAALPNNGTGTVSLNDSILKVVRFAGIASNTAEDVPIPNNSVKIRIQKGASPTMLFTTTENYSSYAATIDLWYRK
jgi:hypothetical protein